VKRHPCLEPFSRDHNVGLTLAKHLSQRGLEALPEFRQAWVLDLEDHFAEEERLLTPLLDSERAERLRSEHRQIEARAESCASDADAVQLGTLLHDHIRWEERELFVWLEQHAGEPALRTLGRLTDAIEQRRTNPLRAEQVARHPKPSDEPPTADLRLLAALADSAGPQWGMETEDLNATLLFWRQGRVQEHVNDEVDVLIVVLEGEAELVIGDQSMLVRAGQTVAVPKGARRSLTARSARLVHLNVHRRRRKLMPR
jgi:mannose-6-phosphate isomerase-like protein (cupin superfamily)